MFGWVGDRLEDFKPASNGKKKKKPSNPLITWSNHRGQGLDAALKLALLRWRDARSLLTLWTAAMMADGETDPRESKALEALTMRSRVMRRLSQNERDKLIVQVHKDLGLNDETPENPSKREREKIIDKRWKAIEKATRAFRVSQPRKLAVYLQINDILYADQELATSEKIFRDEVVKMLAIPEGDVIRCNDLIAMKNAH